MIVFGSTKRGLLRGDFQDRNGADCSIQESSYVEEPCLWLGQVGPDFHRMHLTREMARELALLLRHFARTGSLGQDDPTALFQVGAWVVGVGENNRGVRGRIIEIDYGGKAAVQDHQRSGLEGRIVCLWKDFDLLWEPSEEPPDEGITLLDQLDRLV